MPSVSKSQQRLFGQALALKTGEITRRDLDPRWAQEIYNLADSMSVKKLRAFAKTKHKGLPEKVGESRIFNFTDFISENYLVESTDWSKLTNQMFNGYFNKIMEENSLDQILDDLEDVCLEISDISKKTTFDKTILIRESNKVNTKPVAFIPETWWKKGISEITDDGKSFHKVKSLPVTEYSWTGGYSHFTQVRSFLHKSLNYDSGWLNIVVTFDFENSKKKRIQGLFKYIKENLLSRGWFFNPRIHVEEFFSGSSEFSFEIIRRISLKEANNEVPQLFAETSPLLNEGNKTTFFGKSQIKFSEISSDLNDIALELKDVGISINIDKYIDDQVFEIQIDIDGIKSKTHKRMVEEVAFRYYEFIKMYDLDLLIIPFIQKEGGNVHRFEFFDMDELKNLDQIAGEIDFSLVFGVHA
jgi:hypothetical protein